MQALRLTVQHRKLDIYNGNCDHDKNQTNISVRIFAIVNSTSMKQSTPIASSLSDNIIVIRIIVIGLVIVFIYTQKVFLIYQIVWKLQLHLKLILIQFSSDSVVLIFLRALESTNYDKFACNCIITLLFILLLRCEHMSTVIPEFTILRNCRGTANMSRFLYIYFKLDIVNFCG